jgi:dCTP deaminase
MSTLTGPEIFDAIERGDIEVDPFDPVRIGSNSLDMTLGGEIKIYVDRDGRPLDLSYGESLFMHPQDGNVRSEKSLVAQLDRKGAILDAREPRNTKRVQIPEEGLVLLPGRGYLAHTVEHVKTDLYVPHMHGRSSMGRLFLSIHQTAGWGDIGFAGEWTMEITCVHPVRVYAGMAIAQIAFDEPIGEVLLYGDRKGSKYQNSRGAEASRSHRDFRSEDE